MFVVFYLQSCHSLKIIINVCSTEVRRATHIDNLELCELIFPSYFVDGLVLIIHAFLFSFS